MMKLPRDFKKLLTIFNANQVDQLVVGGYAVAYFRMGLPLFQIEPLTGVSGNQRTIEIHWSDQGPLTKLAVVS